MPDGNAQPVRFRVTTPGDPEELRQRCIENEARGLTEAQRRNTCIIVGSGPSAKDPALWERLADPSLCIPTVAVNGALSLFIEHKIEPYYWCCCDPQELVCDFIPENIQSGRTEFMVASKCPPSLFDKLQRLRCATRIWRIDELAETPNKLRVPTAVSITMVTQNLMRYKGFHHFEMYGWDCCYLDGEHHANDQPDVSDRLTYCMQNPDGSPHAEFETSGQWMAEIEDACKQVYNFKVMGYDIEVNGPGAVATHLRANRLIA